MKRQYARLSGLEFSWLATSYLLNPTIANACEESWAEMAGGLRQRHCGSCNKQVHDFAAMTPSEIEKLVWAAQGKLCARVTRRTDGSLVTLEGGTRVSMAVQLVASASLALGTAGAMAQLPAGQLKPAEAVLTGKVVRADGSGPVIEGLVSIRDLNSVVATVKTDQLGDFRISVPPGTYDVIIRQNVLLGTRIFGANLHTGEQSMQPIKTHFYMVRDDGTGAEGYATMGTLAPVLSYTFSGAMRHPLQYLKYLARKH